MAKRNVLFLCTSNSARSQMGEALLRKYAGDQFEVFSAGLEPTEVHPMAIQVMDEIGIDIGGQHAKGIREYMGKMFIHYLITVCADADKSCPQALWANGGHKIHWPLVNPVSAEGTDEERLAVFRQVRDEIDARVQAWLREVAPQTTTA